MAHDPGHQRPTISTHVLDAELGRPAEGVVVVLSRIDEDGRLLRMTRALTDADGRVRDLLEGPLTPGDYRLEFELATRAPLSDDSRRFFRRLTIDFRVHDASRSYHVPLLLSPFAMTTYRGS